MWNKICGYLLAILRPSSASFIQHLSQQNNFKKNCRGKVRKIIVLFIEEYLRFNTVYSEHLPTFLPFYSRHNTTLFCSRS